METPYPKISIVTPSYNQAAYLEQTLNSVLSQGYPNLEYIVIDGGSTDGSVEVIQQYAAQLTYWISEKDQGLYHALQKGFERSSGEIMAWLNSDDLYHRQSLWMVARLFTRYPDAHWIMGKNTFFDEQSASLIYPEDSFQERWSPWRFYQLPPGRFIQQESTFWTRDLWERAGGYINTQLALAGDFDLWARFFRHERLYSTNLLLGGFRDRSANQQSKDRYEEYMQEAREVIKTQMRTRDVRKTYANKKRALSYLRFIPFRGLRHRLRKKILDLPPKIEYQPNDTFITKEG